jgi:DNA-binding XRE family transcriptional regulator
MTDMPKRRRGRPSKADIAAREAAMRQSSGPSEAADEEKSFLDQKLAEPVKKRGKLLSSDDDTLRTVSELAKLFCTQEEIAAVLGVSRRTLQSFLADNPEAHEAWEDGIQYAKISLRRKQLALADKNAPAAIFLGKNYLGQKDEHHHHSTVRSDAKELSETELMEIAARSPGPGTGGKPEKPADKSKMN